jgi:hypothetical protein
MPPRFYGHDEDVLVVRVSKGPFEEFAAIKVLPVPAYATGGGWQSENVRENPQGASKKHRKVPKAASQTKGSELSREDD